MTSQGLFHYSLGRPTGVCAATGREIEPGSAFVGVLAESPGADELERLDFSREAWEDGARPEPPRRVFASWRAVMPARDAKHSPLIDDESLIDLVTQLEGVAEPRRVAFRYVLALILVRRRLLRAEGAGAGELVVRVVRPGHEPGPPMRVVEPALDPASIADVTEQLSEIVLGGGLGGGRA